MLQGGLFYRGVCYRAREGDDDTNGHGRDEMMIGHGIKEEG